MCLENSNHGKTPFPWLQYLDIRTMKEEEYTCKIPFIQ